MGTAMPLGSFLFSDRLLATKVGQGTARAQGDAEVGRDDIEPGVGAQPAIVDQVLVEREAVRLPAIAPEPQRWVDVGVRVVAAAVA